ncbi:DUF2737 family protein [Citrobacter sedlakii]|uniref:DUF2737 family protein n=1 Tax=Citrobacter TaxID=544 RepID=UPI001969E3A0|nr:MULTISPECIES: DUF2737 family protein [Citrobacter]MBM9568992.1 DUF2737 family protein [Citrobacter sedlakii]HBL4691956.1 DUF2737 family protein [Citrobacter sedlakii]HBL4706191.1 DUF2737 family protein [Citrobacter sedlakii]HBL4720844.1 DUF2737 family protein [Citrobacter sedlakii]HCA7841794.1 DUF2737 family protein [Citrobacter sedlakii]
MIGNTYDPGISPHELIARHKFKPMPDKQELLKRDSFDTKTRLQNNKWLNAMLRGDK